MIDTLYVNGCSWTAGNELEEDANYIDYIHSIGLRKQDPSVPNFWNLIDKDNNIAASFEYYYDKFNWAGALQHRLSAVNLINHSNGGTSNHRILRTTLDYVRSCTPEQLSKLLIVIGWTNCQRNELFVNGAWHRLNPSQPFGSTYDHTQGQPLTAEHIAQIEKMQELGTVYLSDEHAKIYEYFTTVYLLSNTLDNLGVKYMFFNALPAWWTAGDLQTACDVAANFPGDIDYHTTHTNIMHYDDSMYHFVDRNKLPVARYQHPLHSAHTAWAKYLHSELKTRRIV